MGANVLERFGWFPECGLPKELNRVSGNEYSVAKRIAPGESEGAIATRIAQGRQ
jgi:hypothetical protein